MHNEFNDESFIRKMERLKVENPRRYAVSGLGEWGVAEGLVYENFEVMDFNHNTVRNMKDQWFRPLYKDYFGLDFGYKDPTAFIAILVSNIERTIYVYDEHYETGMSTDEIANMLFKKGYAHSRIQADSARPDIIAELRSRGITRIIKAKKSRTVMDGVQKIQDYKIIIHPNCVNTVMEINSYVFDTDVSGQLKDRPIDKYNHLMDALRYACGRITANTWEI